MPTFSAGDCLYKLQGPSELAGMGASPAASKRVSLKGWLPYVKDTLPAACVLVVAWQLSWGQMLMILVPCVAVKCFQILNKLRRNIQTRPEGNPLLQSPFLQRMDIWKILWRLAAPW